MSELLQAILLGVVQGLTEFLPVSSSAHLALVPWLLGFQAAYLYTLTFDVALHVGTLAAVLLYFWRDWVAMADGAVAWVGTRIRAPRQIVRRSAEIQAEPPHATDWHTRLAVYLLVGSLPAALAGLLLDRYAEAAFRHPVVIAAALAGFGVLLALADWRVRCGRPLDRVRWQDSMLIGLAQALAIVPGVSRSGVTITAGLLLGLRRESAARFSFLLMAPVVAGAAAVKGAQLLEHGLPADQIGPFAAGTLAAAAVGVLAIAFLVHYLRIRRLWPFAVYRLVLAAVVVVAVTLRVS